MRRAYVVAALALVLGCNIVLGNEKGELIEQTKDDARGNACTKGFADCNGDPRDGCEARLSEPANCGGCGIQCGATSGLCVSVADNQFTCASGCPPEAIELCGYQCVNRKTNAAHCGQCGHACSGTEHGEAVCRDSKCAVQCANGYHACGASCAANNDPLACGDKCTACAGGPRGSAVCNNGTCGIACVPGAADCDGDVRNGCETSVWENAKHCGGCGRPCTNARCVGGLCLPLGGATSSSDE